MAEYIGRDDVAYTCLPFPAHILSKALFALDLFSVMFEAAGAVLLSQAGHNVQAAERSQQVRTKW